MHANILDFVVFHIFSTLLTGSDVKLVVILQQGFYSVICSPECGFYVDLLNDVISQFTTFVR